VNQQQPLKKSTKDWIKVNGFVSLAFSILLILVSTTLMSNSDIRDQVFNTLPSYSNIPNLSDVQFKQFINIAMEIILVYSIVLTIHIICSLIYISKYSRLHQNGTGTV
jgi:hypothetical protein